MDKETFYNILIQSTPEEINNLISSKGKKKPVNAITFIKTKKDSKEDQQNERESKRSCK